MIVYLKENTNNKKIYVDESKIHLLKERFDENMEDEGGIYYINDIDGNILNADYEYIDGDDNIYADYTPYAKRNKLLHPQNPTWFADVNHATPYDSYGSFKKGGKGLKDSNPYSEYVNYYGKTYMPTKRIIGKGDKIKEIGKLSPDMVEIGSGIFIPCYNLSKLGVGTNDKSTFATMIAHTYKGKDASYGSDKKMKNFKLRTNGGNLINGLYKNKLTELIQSTPDLINFNPNYIVFPESSSKFNDYIAEFLHNDIFPNAILIPNGKLIKNKTWDINYDELIYQTLKEVNKHTYFRDMYSKSRKMKRDFISEVLLTRFSKVMFNQLCRKIYHLKYLKDDGIYNSGEFGDNLSKSKQKRASILTKIEEIVHDEIDKLDAALTRNKIEFLRTATPYSAPFKEKLMLSVFNRLFTNETISKYNGEYASKAKGNRISLYSNLHSLEKAYIDGKIDFDNAGIKQMAQKNDTIKNYDYQTRMALSGQFKFKNNFKIKGVNNNSRFLIIDDNYASGASIRNAAIAIQQTFGVPYTNIIALTPGDMGGASSGGDQGAEIPTNNAEGYLAYNYTNGNYKNIKLDKKTVDRLSYVNDKYGNTGMHKKNNKIRDVQQGNLGQRYSNGEHPYKNPYMFLQMLNNNNFIEEMQHYNFYIDDEDATMTAVIPIPNGEYDVDGNADYDEYVIRDINLKDIWNDALCELYNGYKVHNGVVEMGDWFVDYLWKKYKNIAYPYKYDK